MVPPGAFVPSVHHHRRGGLSTTHSDQSFNTRLVVVTILLFMVMSELLVVLIVILLTAPWGLSQRINVWIDLSTIPLSACVQVVFIFGRKWGWPTKKHPLYFRKLRLLERRHIMACLDNLDDVQGRQMTSRWTRWTGFSRRGRRLIGKLRRRRKSRWAILSRFWSRSFIPNSFKFLD